MSSFISLLIFVFIVFGVIRKAKANGNSSKSRSSYNTFNTTTSNTVANRQIQNRTVPNQLYNTSGTTKSGNASITNTKPVHTMNSKTSANQGMNVRKDVSQTNSAEDKKKSTTQILHEKAMKDQAQDQMDKRQQDIENRQVYGNLHYAGRFIPGDPIPKGNKIVYCQYCGAENVVPEFQAKQNYNCYFCREKL